MEFYDTVAPDLPRVAQRFGSKQPQRLPDLPPLRLRRVFEYIDAHLDQDLTLAELAGVACLSPCHFSRSFKDAMGVGPQRYTMQRRVERAKNLFE
jgi:transcriptional regulator GlxA family with amidase domain